MKTSAPALLTLLAAASATIAQTTAPSAPPQLYETARASLVVVRYTWASELGPRPVELPGVVIDASGIVMCNASIVNDAVPIKQIQDVKIVVPRPGDEPLELAAEFQGRDDRVGLAYFKATASHDWKPLVFASVPLTPGQTVTSVGLSGRNYGYRPMIGQSMISMVRPEGPMAMIDGRLSGVGAVVFDTQGRAVGYAASPTPGERGQPPQMNLFAPATAFFSELADRPTPQNPIVAPWLGAADWNGLKADEAEYYGVKTPAIHVGAVWPGGPLDQAGIKPGQVIVGYEGQPLERGDDADSIPQLLRQAVLRSKPGSAVRFDVIESKGQPAKTITVTLAATPPAPNTAERYWSEDLGMGVRDSVFVDRFSRRLAADASGVVVTMVRPGSPAEVAQVPPDAVVKEVAGTPVTDVKSFSDAVKRARQSKPGEAVVILVNQNGRDATLRIDAN